MRLTSSTNVDQYIQNTTSAVEGVILLAARCWSWMGNCALVDSESIQKSDSLITQNTNNFTANDAIINDSKNHNTALKNYLIDLKKTWKDRANPLIVTYEGNDFGDYHHIEFEDAEGIFYDFGFGENNFGDIKLFFDDEQMNDNPKYLGKKFTVFWDWKISTFPCCDGEYDLVEAYIPSIVKLELIESNTTKK